MIEIIEANAAHEAAIADMTRAAFTQEYGSGDGEVTLIAALRAGGDVIVELVAKDGDDIVGHILFSRMTDQPFTGRIAGLAPMCAKLGRQKQGIGSALVRQGLSRCRAKGVRAVFVLGDNAYYGRFGFSAASAEGIACAFAGPHFMALEIEPGALAGVKRVEFASAFFSADA